VAPMLLMPKTHMISHFTLKAQQSATREYR
jgi:hypothetical protein